MEERKMLSEDKYFRNLTEVELWQRYCGFLDLSLSEFMDIQRELLMDEIERVADSILGKKIMGGKKPKSVEEFQHTVPLTTYEDYEPYLSERREDALAIKPELWCHSSGRSGKFKWMPNSSEYLDRVTHTAIAMLILATAKYKGKVNLSPTFRFLMILPPAPYTSGAIFDAVAKRLSFRPIPDPREVGSMEFSDRVQTGFKIALREGVDFMGSIGSVLVRMGEAFNEQTQNISFSPGMLHPKLFFRLLRAWMHAKIERRRILPKDIWPAKAVLAGGMDASIYRDDIIRYWGNDPYEPYSLTEAANVAIPDWTRNGVIFRPDLVFLEFIPYEEQSENQYNTSALAPTVLFDQVEIGKSYEFVITHFYGMPLLRYRTKDIIKIVSLEDKEAGSRLPHAIFQYRLDDVINLGSLAQLDEKTLWQALANTHIKYVDWTAYKEYDQNKTFLRFCIEPKEEIGADEIAVRLSEELKKVDVDYVDVESYLNISPLRVTLLSPGTFNRYMEEKKEEGADLAQLKPSHVNPPQDIIESLIRHSEDIK
jgi:hypothetical protein